jgi:hypothetical protein
MLAVCALGFGIGGLSAHAHAGSVPPSSPAGPLSPPPPASGDPDEPELHPRAMHAERRANLLRMPTSPIG